MPQVLLPQRKRNQLEALGQALQVASVGFGIRDAVKNSELLDKKLAQLEAEAPYRQRVAEAQALKAEAEGKIAQRRASGIASPLELQSLAGGRSLIPSQQGTPGAIQTTSGQYVSFSPLTAMQTEQLKLAGIKSKAESANTALAKTEKQLRVAELKRKPIDTLVKERENAIITKDTQKIAGSFRRVLATEDTAAGDLSLIFNFMKMLDPGSVVREGEFATAQNAAGIPDRVKNIYNNALKGQRLTADQKKNMLSQSQRIFREQLKQQKQFDDGVIKAAEKRGIAADVGIFPKLNISEQDIRVAFERFGGSPTPQLTRTQQQILLEAQDAGMDPLEYVDQLIKQKSAVGAIQNGPQR